MSYWMLFPLPGPWKWQKLRLWNDRSWCQWKWPLESCGKQSLRGCKSIKNHGEQVSSVWTNSGSPEEWLFNKSGPFFPCQRSKSWQFVGATITCEKVDRERTHGHWSKRSNRVPQQGIQCHWRLLAAGEDNPFNFECDFEHLDSYH